MRKPNLLVLLIFVIFSGECFAQPASCAYSYRKRITFNPAMVAGTSDLTNFPVLINIGSDNDLRTTANSGHVQNTNGYDIIFTAEDGVTRLDHQVERYTASSGELVAWVRIPSLSTSINTYIYMYYGNSSISSDQSSTAAWNTGYKGVWHLNNSIADGTSNGNNGTNSGTTNTTTAKIAGGRVFAGTGTNYLQVGLSGASGGSGNGSVSFWGKVSSYTTSTYFFGESTGQTGGGYANRIQLYLGDASGTLYLGIGGNHTIQTNLQVMSLNTWYHVAFTWATTGAGVGNYSVFVNGAQAASGNYSAFSNIHTFADLGNDGNASQRTEELPGQMDEVHVTNTTLSSGWITTEYNNQNSPATFYSISAEPNVFTGASNSNWTAAGNWSSGSAPTGSTDVIISITGSNQPNLNTTFQANSVWIRPSNALSINNNQSLSVFYDITNCGSITGSNANSLVQLNGTAIKNQHLSGNGTYSLRDLTVNNTFSVGPMVILGSDVAVANDLVLTSGIVSTSTVNLLSLAAGATSGSGSGSSFVSGPMSKAGATAFVFPVGKGSSWRRVGISASLSASTFQAEYFNTPYANTTPVNSPMDNVSSLEYWQLDRVGTASVNVSLYWESATASGINNCADLTIARWNGSSWDERAATSSTSSTCSGAGTGVVTTTAVVPAFSPFTFGSKSTTLNPLPIELIEFKGLCQDGKVLLNWSTAREWRNDRYIIEKSADGLQWTELKQVEAKGNSSTLMQYQLEDPLPEELNYYRLSQVDVDGTRKTFRSVVVTCNRMDNAFFIYPNPAGKELNIRFELVSTSGKARVKLTDHLGREVLIQDYDLPKGTSIQQLSLSVPPGAYILSCDMNNVVMLPKQLVIE